MSEAWLRALVLACIFGAVLLAAEVLVGWLSSRRSHGHAINLRLKMIGQGRPRGETMNLLRRSTGTLPTGLPPAIKKLARRMERMLIMAQVTIPTSRLLLGLLLAPLIVFFLILALMILTGTAIGFGRLVLVGVFAAAAGGLIPIMVLQFFANRSRKKIQDQFPVAIDVFVRGLRAGHPVAAALDLLTVEMPDPIGSEFGVVVDEVTYGADLRDALHAMAERWDLDDMRMFVVSLSVQNETGGNLAEILENLSTVIRERASMMMKVRALSSEGRMTAIMLTILPVFAFVMLFILSPEFYLDVADDPAFVPGFVAMLVSYSIGVFWIRKLVDLKV
jgi:tight adherence protein B